MKRIMSVWLMIVCLLMLKHYAIAQATAENISKTEVEQIPPNDEPSQLQLTLAETRAATRIIQQFETKLIESGEMEIALQGLTARDYYERSARYFGRNDANIGFGIIDSAILRNNPSEFRRGYFALLNAMYLISINYQWNKFDRAKTEEDSDWRQYFSPDVQQTWLVNPLLRLIITNINNENISDELLGKYQITTLSDYLALVRCIENANDLLRRYATVFRSQSSTKFQQVLSEASDGYSSAPRLHICNEACGLLPDGTRAIVINYLLYQFTLIKDGEGWKIIYVIPRLGD